MTRPQTTRILALIVALAVTGRSASAQTSTDSTPSGKSVLHGVYSEAQAARGEETNRTYCTSCHGTENYTGDTFKRTWLGRTLFDLFDRIRTTMPEDNPNGLTAQQYTDVIVYILKLNGFPAGPDSLPPDQEAMRQIKIEVKP